MKSGTTRQSEMLRHISIKKALTNFTDGSRLFVVGVDHHQLHGKMCHILDLECRAECDDLDIILEFHVANDPVENLFHTGLESVGRIAFSINRDIADPFPRHSFELDSESVMTTG